MSAPFTFLHVHSHYSLLKALPKIPDLVATAKEAGCEALALTDIDNLYGAIEFYKECQSAGIKPIIGLDAYVGDEKRILLLVTNIAGYQNLLQLVTKSHFEFPERPTVTEAMLKEHSEGIIQLDPKATDIALPEIFYLQPKDRRAWETMRAIENKGANEGGDIGNDENDFHFPTTEEMQERFTQSNCKKQTTSQTSATSSSNWGRGTSLNSSSRQASPLTTSCVG
jgi:DNA polymerase III alpha subunit